jgi:hypothetical protein
MVDLDQGGVSRQWSRNYLGPSIGWIDVPWQNLLPVTAAGTYNIDPSTIARTQKNGKLGTSDLVEITK